VDEMRKGEPFASIKGISSLASDWSADLNPSSVDSEFQDDKVAAIEKLHLRSADLINQVGSIT
jgi:hypothetical protein